MTIQQFFVILWARRAFVFVTLVGALTGAALVMLLLPPRYEATSRVMLNFIKPDPVTGEIISSSFARTYAKTQTELIRDYRVAGVVVDRLGMAGDPALQARYARLAQGQRPDFRRWLADSVIARTSADLVPGTNILEISYRSTNAEIARIVADQLRQAYIDNDLATRREEAQRSADWFQRQADEAQRKLTEAEGAKAAFEKANNIVLQEDNQDIDSLRLAALASASAPPAGAAAAVSPAAAQLAQVDAAIAQAADRLGPNHPQMRALREQRAALARQAAGETAAARQAATSGAAFIGREVAAQRARVIAQRDKLGELRKLKDNVDRQRDLLAKLNERMNALRQESEAGQTGLAPLGSAVLPSAPYFPNRPLLLAGAIGFGLAIGGLSGLLAELLGRRVRGAPDMTGGFDMPLLGVMPAPPRPRGSLAARLRHLFWPRYGAAP